MQHAPNAAETELALRLAAVRILEEGWGRPLALDSEATVEVGGRPTLVGAILGPKAAEVRHWTDLATPALHDAWDALALALAVELGIWRPSPSGFEVIDRVLRWERSPEACREDVAAVLRTAAILAGSAASMVPCPICNDARGVFEPRPPPPDCTCCAGEGVLTLPHDRWERIRIVRRTP